MSQRNQYQLHELTDDTPCACGQNWGWHLIHKPKHPFVPPAEGALVLSQHEAHCVTCGHPESNHPYRHPFAATKDGSTAFLGAKKDKDGTPAPIVTTERSPWPLDPVLRTALINKGVITPQDLRDAEELIRATTAQFESSVRESRNGEFAEETRGREV